MGFKVSLHIMYILLNICSVALFYAMFMSNVFYPPSCVQICINLKDQISFFSIT